jgi:hypothetical protein
MGHLVVCREDRQEDGSPGKYTLATRRVFDSNEEAVEYSLGINSSREPLVIEGRFDQLRFSGPSSP